MKVPEVSTLPEEEGTEEKTVDTPSSRKSCYNLRPSELLKKRLSPTTMKKACQSSTPTPRRSMRKSMKHRVQGSASKWTPLKETQAIDSFYPTENPKLNETMTISPTISTVEKNIEPRNLQLDIADIEMDHSDDNNKEHVTPSNGIEERTKSLLNTTLNIEKEDGPVPPLFTLQSTSSPINKPSVTPQVKHENLYKHRGRLSKKTPVAVQPLKGRLTTKIPRKTLSTVPSRKISVVVPISTNNRRVTVKRKSVAVKKSTVSSTARSTFASTTTTRQTTIRQPLGELKGYMRPTLSSQLKMNKKDTLKPERHVPVAATPKTVRSRSTVKRNERSAIKTKYFGKTVRPKK